MWFTPPRISALNLRLRSLNGGGSYPSQFDGVTEDGRPIFVHYRGGYISIDQGDIGASPGDPMKELLSTRIGPPLHGVILIEQACEILGLSAPGISKLTKERFDAAVDKDPIEDLSGATTFWDRSLLAHQEDIVDLVHYLGAHFSRVAILEPYLEGSKRRYRQSETVPDGASFLQLGFEGEDVAIGRLITEPNVSISEFKDAFAVILNIRIHRITAANPNDEFPDEEIAACHTIFLSMQCPTQSGSRRDMAEEIAAAIASQIERRVDRIEIETGRVLERNDIWHGRSLANWCKQKPNRFLRIFNDRSTGEKQRIGLQSGSD
ncbi:MAG: hypothetical protein IPK59_14780 [Rhodospirillaceae bacterium]|nr:hypothetical protein [Rhodospirillaceae bacterium]